MELTEDLLNKMTPEQLEALQKQKCVFCYIVQNKISSKKIYEDDLVTAVLDINPANPGHTLLIPKEHYSILPQLPDDVNSRLFMVAKGISLAALKVLKAKGSNIFIANGVAAGQKSPHFILHIIPRIEEDSLTDFKLTQGKPKKEDLEETQTKITEVLKNYPEILTQEIVKPTQQPTESLKPSQKTDYKVEDVRKISDMPVIKAAAKEIEPVVASNKGEKFHKMNCPFGKRIKKENKLFFSSKQKAINHGFKPCTCIEDKHD